MTEKLVRDHIPDIVRAEKGSDPGFRVAGRNEYRDLLVRKLEEEVGEYLAERTMEELADILEVILHLAAEAGLSPEELEIIRRAKERERGGFQQRFVMDFQPEQSPGSGINALTGSG